jgi:hypothetical protein
MDTRGWVTIKGDAERPQPGTVVIGSDGHAYRIVERKGKRVARGLDITGPRRVITLAVITCAKKPFPSREAAMDAVVQARTARALNSNTKRREDRAYQCPTCPRRPWHLTSTPERSQ